MSSLFDKEKCFPNPFNDFTLDQRVLDDGGHRLLPEIKKSINSTISRLLNMGRSHWDSNKKDASVYTGTLGIAMMYLLMYHKFGDKSYLIKAEEMVKPALKYSKFGRSITFITGDSGVFALAAVISDQMGYHQERDGFLNQLVALKKYVQLDETPDELLYGRSGYLYSLLFVRHQIPNCQPIVRDDLIRYIIDAILASGRKTASQEKSINPPPPLMYYWHDKAYIGAAHGFAGILHTLLLAREYVCKEDMETLIRPTINFVMKLRYRSGNYQSSIGSETDRLVQWCHGSPAVIHLMALAYQVFGDERYLESALGCGDVIWQRGLLKKGYGLCHGAAGNAYAFVKLYQVTKDEKHAYRAIKFAEWIGDYGKHSCRTPDRPYSLFEGLAGTIYFLVDLLEPGKCCFPAYEIPSFGTNIQERMV